MLANNGQYFVIKTILGANMSLKFNPFRPNTMVHPEMFRGRYRELIALEKAIFQTKNGNPHHFIIEGERGIGKSSLMLYLDFIARGELHFLSEKNFKPNFLVITVELTTDVGMVDIVQKVAEGFKLKVMRKEVLKQRAKAVWEFLINWEVLGVKYNKDENVLDPILILDNLCEQIASLLQSEAKKNTNTEPAIDGILVLIDEADKPAASAHLGEFSKLFTEKLIRLNCNNVSLGLAGQSSLLQKLKESHESSPRIFTIYTLEPLANKDILDILEAGVKEANAKNEKETHLAPEAPNLLVELSEGYPHFVQQFAYSAFEVDTDYYLTKDDILGGAYGPNGALEQLGKKFFQQQYFEQIGSEDYRKVLQVMSEHSDKWVSRSDILSMSGLKDHTINNAIQALKAKGIIIVNEQSKGSYKLPSKSFAAWIKALNHTPAKN